jgi:DNA uptake protein ComE-like DNA-binding protein
MLSLAIAALALSGSAALAQNPATQGTKPGSTAPAPATVTRSTAAKPPAAEALARPDAGSADKLDLNSASVAQLAELKGIGPVRAEAIVKGRPYSGKDDLVRRKIIPQSVYDEVKDQVIARQK